ncbi:MAG: DUF5000 domain-containing lipoprotein [Flavobacteriaceae bacterium]|nr:DUF5000 domain-containing lipoprotein [Flavobacteriaceae bacterium]
MKIILNTFGIVLMVLFLGCDEKRIILESDKIPPPPVSNVRFTPINGGFDILYDLPSETDVLYVLAEYTNNNGEPAEQRTSTFNNRITIIGFGDISQKTIDIYTVDRSKNKSTPVSITGVPLAPVVDIVAESLKIQPSFGGVKISWLNEKEVPIVIDIFAENEDGELEDIETVYSEQLEQTVSVRDRESVPQQFKVSVSDRYGNQSSDVFPNTPDKLLTPFKETYLDKSLFQQVTLDNDDTWDAWGSSFGRMYNDNYGAEDWAHTLGNKPRPTILTIDLGTTVELNRFKLFHRGGNWGFAHANPKTYTLFGSLEIPGQDGHLDDWIKIRECESIKPSGLPVGTLSNEDRQAILDGEEFEIDNLVKIRYVRIAVYTAWGGNNATHIVELDFWGRVEEEIQNEEN